MQIFKVLAIIVWKAHSLMQYSSNSNFAWNIISGMGLGAAVTSAWVNSDQAVIERWLLDHSQQTCKMIPSYFTKNKIIIMWLPSGFQLYNGTIKWQIFSRGLFSMNFLQWKLKILNVNKLIARGPLLQPPAWHSWGNWGRGYFPDNIFNCVLWMATF